MQTQKILFCAVLALLLQQEVRGQEYLLERLNENISTSQYHEIAPCVSKDGRTLYFTRIAFPEFESTLVENGENLSKSLNAEKYDERLSEIYSEIAGQPIQNPKTSIFNQDIWIAHSVHDDFDLIEHPTYPLNNALPNSVSDLSPGDHPIIINQFNPTGGMQKGFSQVQKLPSGDWNFPEGIGIDRYHNSGPDVNLSMSSDGKVMIISMEREDSYGQSDLYISHLKEDNTWTYPRNLGRAVNSPYRESTPHLSEDMKTLYFSSDRTRPGRGNDIYVQTRLDEAWSEWWAPKRFRTPINSDGDDSHPYFNPATGYLYFTSDRDGSSDIFRIQIMLPAQRVVLASGKTKLMRGSKIEFRNIYFAQSKAQILSASYPELDRLHLLLSQNPGLYIRIEGHTDNVGEPSSLQQLSEERAEAIKDFLVDKKGINAARIKTIGYGASHSINDNSTLELRSKNRRVEISVLEIDQHAVSLQLGTK